MQPTPNDTSNKAPSTAQAVEERRSFLVAIPTLAMAGGLACGYGTFFVMAGQYLYPDPDPGAWYFVAQVDQIDPGASLAFESPSGLKVVVKRRAAAAESPSVDIEQFIALSSTCPHLGCRVHWESQNNRFFCPCHNGQFDAEGRPTGGPPLAAKQQLPRYLLKLEDGLLFIRMPTRVAHPGSSGQGERRMVGDRLSTHEDRS